MCFFMENQIEKCTKDLGTEKIVKVVTDNVTNNVARPGQFTWTQGSDPKLTIKNLGFDRNRTDPFILLSLVVEDLRILDPVRPELEI